MRLILLLLLLTGCEAIDQFGHFTYGRFLSCELVRNNGNAEGSIALVDTFAQGREELDHPGECGKGCQRDLKHFHNGAVEGVKC